MSARSCALSTVTGTAGTGLLYPPLAPGESGLIDSLRSVDKRRIRLVFGELSRNEITAIDEGVAVYPGLGGQLTGQMH